MSWDALPPRSRQIDALNRRFRGRFRIFKGIEANILGDGRLDMPADELAVEAEARGFDSLYLPEHTHIPTSRRTPPPTGDAELKEEYKRTVDPLVILADADIELAVDGALWASFGTAGATTHVCGSAITAQVAAMRSKVRFAAISAGDARRAARAVETLTRAQETRMLESR